MGPRRPERDYDSALSKVVPRLGEHSENPWWSVLPSGQLSGPKGWPLRRRLFYVQSDALVEKGCKPQLYLSQRVQVLLQRSPFLKRLVQLSDQSTKRATVVVLTMGTPTVADPVEAAQNPPLFQRKA